MKIDYHQNPLRSQVFLDETEKKLLKANIKNELLLEALAAVWYQFRKKDPPSLEKIKEEVSFFDDDEDSVLSVRVNDLYDVYIKELEESYMHIGDCTCVPATCYKCLAEEHAGVDTIEGLGKHLASRIDRAFKDSSTSIDEAIEMLNTPISEKPNAEYINHPEIYRVHRPRWEQDRVSALKWLVNYKIKHFSKLSGYSAHTIIVDDVILETDNA